MSWYSDGERFDEYEGCERCNFRNRRGPDTCGNCYWNEEDWGDDPCAECEGRYCDTCTLIDEEEEEEEE